MHFIPIVLKRIINTGRNNNEGKLLYMDCRIRKFRDSINSRYITCNPSK